MKKNKGFTLIETIIYIGLFSIVIGGGMVAAYQIIQSTASGNNHVIMEEEANFLLRKINWALTGATPPTTVSVDGKTLTVTKNATTYTFVLNSSTKKFSLNSTILNSSSISVDPTTGILVFVKTPASGSKPESITTSFTLTTVQNGKNVTESFSTTKYLRQ